MFYVVSSKSYWFKKVKINDVIYVLHYKPYTVSTFRGLDYLLKYHYLTGVFIKIE